MNTPSEKGTARDAADQHPGGQNAVDCGSSPAQVFPTQASSDQQSIVREPAGGGVPIGQIDIQTLVEEHYEELYRYAYRLCGNGTDASDLTQQAFLNAHQALGDLREVSKSRGWLYAIVRNTFLKDRRKKTPATAAGLDFDLNHVADPAVQPEDAFPDFDGEQLQTALNDLPEEFRTVLLMFYFEERSYREIADQLEIPDGTVMSRLSRAKQHLRKRLSLAANSGNLAADD